ncbi:MAG: hypothetical protein WCR51_01890 [Planctomycetia bacterium]
MNHDPATIRRLVAEVIARLGVTAASPAPTPAAVSSYGQPQGTSGVAVADKVVTLAALERLPTGTTRVVVTAGAVVTPSAREHARDAGIEIVRGQATPAGPASTRPFIIAHAECGGDAAARCASLARGIPAAQQLPATGLADVVAAIALHASRDGARAILLAGRPAVAVVLANRSAGLRAVTARDAAGLLAAAAECGANLLVVDPKAFSAVSLDRVCGDFSRRDLGVPPTELAAAPTPCACKTHTH